MFEPTPTPHTIRSAKAVMDDLGSGQVPYRGVIPTGFEPLDSALEGGIRTRELTVVGGVPGVGKTAKTLQWARNMAEAGETVIYACYEHDQEDLFIRLLLLEVGDLVEGSQAASLESRRLISRAIAGNDDVHDALSANLLLRMAGARIEAYGERLHLVRATTSEVDIAALRRLVAVTGDASALFVDYLQKIPHPGPDDEERSAHIATGLKEIALNHGVSVVAIVAADTGALDVRRLRLHHLRGASGIGYEADVVLMLNEKARAVSKLHSAYDPVSAETFKQMVVASIDKNRRGPAPIEMEFDKDLVHFRFEPQGRHVAERLIDEDMYPE